MKSEFFLYKKLGLLFLPLFFYGCSTAIKTHHLEAPKKNSDPDKRKTLQDNWSNRTGIPYFLPTNFIEIKIKRTPIKKDEKKDSTIDNIKNIEYSIEPKSILIPDTETRFLLKHNSQPMASDRLCVARSTTGLLQYVQFATDDKSDQILVKVAELAAKTAKTMIAPIPAVPVRDIMDKERKVEETKNKVVREAEAVAIGKPGENNFQKNMLDQIKEVLPEVEDIQFPDFRSLSKSVDSECPKDNICFRTLKQARLLVKGKFKEGIPIPFNAVATVSVVDLDHVGKLRIDRPFLVDQITKLGFTDGVLTSMAFKRPSEGLAVVSLPLDMLDAVLAVPANFFSSALSGIFSDQKTLYEQQKEIAGLQQKIREEKNKNSVPTDTPDTDTNFNLECTSLSNKDK